MSLKEEEVKEERDFLYNGLSKIWEKWTSET
jgi:hypothetical protein